MSQLPVDVPMTHEEYLQAINKLTPLEAWKLGALQGTLIGEAEKRGYNQAREELARTAIEPGGLRMMHPEEYCHRCFGPNLPWVAPSPLWNEVMRGGDINGREPFEGIVCPMCFMTLAVEKDIASGWRVNATTVKAELQYVTPSGRRWDDARWLWVDSVEQGS